MSAALTLADARVLSSREAVDGLEWIAEAVYPGARVHELTVGRHIIAPSGREYRISGLHWTAMRWRLAMGPYFKVTMLAHRAKP